MRPAQGQALDLRFLVGLSVLHLISWGSVFYGFSLFMVPIEQSLGLTRAECEGLLQGQPLQFL